MAQANAQAICTDTLSSLLHPEWCILLVLYSIVFPQATGVHIWRKLQILPAGQRLSLQADFGKACTLHRLTISLTHQVSLQYNLVHVSQAVSSACRTEITAAG